jgi:uracil-DNA glycosylase
VRIVVVGDVWNTEDAEARAPFTGAGGRLLHGMFRQVGIDKNDCFFTNVFNHQPQPSNDLKNLCGAKADGIPGYPSLTAGKYVLAKYKKELDRLHTEIQAVKPNLILALGTAACWALGVDYRLSKVRGAATQSRFGKVFPTYHPNMMFRDWSLRPVLLADLAKAAKEADFPEVRRPAREIWIEPELYDLKLFADKYLIDCPNLSIDIETSGNYITCIGFAPNTKVALVVPFIKHNGKPYWEEPDDELWVWTWVKTQCRQAKHVTGQNFLYDCHRLWRTYGITVPGMADDTMLLHHALYPELEKGLGFLGSVYTNEARWKFMRNKDTLKKEDE